MMRKLIFFFLIGILFLSCQEYGTDNLFYRDNTVDNRVNKLEDITESFFETLPEKYSFIIITDLHYGSVKKNPPKLPDKQFFEWLEKFDDSEKPAFCLCLGDVADTGSSSQFKEFEELVEKLEEKGIRVLNSLGNHDLYNSGWEGWNATCYPYSSFYTFRTSSYSFYSLDTGSGDIGVNQMDVLISALKNDPRPKIIFTHYPLYTEKFFFNFDNTTDRNLLISYFSKCNVKMYLSGHLHKYEDYDFGSFQTYVIPSYRYNSAWALVNVNEKTQTYTLERIKTVAN